MNKSCWDDVKENTMWFSRRRSTHSAEATARAKSLRQDGSWPLSRSRMSKGVTGGRDIREGVGLRSCRALLVNSNRSSC